MGRSWLLVRNAAAGGDERQTVTALRQELGPRAELAVTETPEELAGLVDRLAGRTLVVCGGDGSVHAVIDRLHTDGLLDRVELGIVPTGTGNDLARTLGLPGEPEAAAAVLRDGRPRRLDLLVADDGAVCVNALHAGVGVDAAERAAELKGPLGRLAYPLGAVIAAAGAEGLDLHVTVDGRRITPGQHRGVLLVAVANGPTVGGGTQLAPGAAPDDGRLEVVVCAAVARGARAGFGAALAAGRHLQRSDVAHAAGEVVTVTGDPVVYNVDGELGDRPHRERTWRLRPGAWRALTPRR